MTAPNPDSANPIAPLLEQVLLADAPEQSAELERLCGEHPELASRLREAFELAESIGRSMRVAAGASHPESIGGFRVLDTLGEGGMGTVYLAEQTDGVHRRVAIKVIKLGFDSKEVVGRFEFERRALAAMNHRCIAKVFEVGTTGHGQPYFVMELVQGVMLTRYCAEHGLGLRQRIELFCQVCSGVQHAHQKGIIHRDLKPANILVTTEDGEPVPKILDFGLAKATNQELVAQTLHTAFEQVLGTPEYMSPEQAAGDAEVLDLRTDVYSLGVVLYELLVGVVPFGSEQLRSGGWAAMRRVLTENEPEKPSTRISSTDAPVDPERRPPGDLTRLLRGDLDWITMRALAKEPDRRYESAAAFADDLRRHLQHEPVTAGPPSTAYRLKKLARKYRAQCAAAATVLVVLIAGVVTSWVFYVDAEANRRDVEARERALLTERSETRRMADVMLLAQKRHAAEQLWPLAAGLVARIDAYTADCRTLLGRLEQHERGLAAIEAEALPYTEEERERDHGETKARIAQHAGAEEQLRKSIAKVPGSAVELQYRDLMRRHAEARAKLEGRLTQRVSWSFPPDVDDFVRWRHGVLRRLVTELREFREAPDGTIRMLQERRHRVEVMVRRTLTDAQDEWRRCAERIAASPRYGGLAVRPQEGLIPLGPDPESRLEEFLHWLTHDPERAIPARGADGKLPQPDSGTGVILVLIPGGEDDIGGTRDEAGPNYHRGAGPWSQPVSRVTLDPYFIGKHELTRGQWVRMSGARDRSYWTPSLISDELPARFYQSLPVDSVSWAACAKEFGRVGLVLPTEARWEFACRAGTDTPWSWGDNWEFVEYANLGDLSFDRRFDRAERSMKKYDDGFFTVAPVGSLLPNPFGLYDVHGNLHEWCMDEFGPLAGGHRPGDGLLLKSAGLGAKSYRGGSFDNAVYLAASHARAHLNPGHSLTVLGARAARELER